MNIDSNVLISGSTLSPTGVLHNNCPTANPSQKWWVALVFGLVFLIIANPIFVWIIVTTLNAAFGESGDRSLAILLIQTIVFIIIIRLILS
jgi:hypothetical protein